jgi:hypothetical protein
MPDRQGQGGCPVPHRPVPAGAPPGEGAQRPGPAAAQARLGLDRAAPAVGGRLRAGGARADRVRPRLHQPPVPGHPDRLTARGGRHPYLRRKISTRTVTRPELDKAVALAREIRASGIVFTVLAALSGMEREYIRDRTLEGHESARARGKAIGGAAVTDDAMLAVALHLRGQELSLRGIATRLVIATGKKKGQHPSPATVLRMLRDHDEKAAAAAVPTGG